MVVGKRNLLVEQKKKNRERIFCSCSLTNAVENNLWDKVRWNLLIKRITNIAPRCEWPPQQPATKKHFNFVCVWERSQATECLSNILNLSTHTHHIIQKVWSESLVHTVLGACLVRQRCHHICLYLKAPCHAATTCECHTCNLAKRSLSPAMDL